MTLMIMGFWRVSRYPQLMALNVIIIFHYLFIYLTADDKPAATAACVLSPVTPSAVERTECRSAADLSAFLFRNLEKFGS